MPPGGGVEGGNAHQAVDAALGLQQAVGILARDFHGHRLDPALGFQQVDDLNLAAAPLRPARVHAQQHGGPVAGLGAARPGVDGQEGRGGIPLLTQQLQEIELGEILLQLLQAAAQLRLHGLVLLLHRQLVHLLLIRHPGPQRLPGLPTPPELLQHRQGALGALAILPELGVGGLDLQLGDLRLQGLRVKDASRIPRSAP